MYAPHTVTVYNIVNDLDLTTFKEQERTYITILRGVFFDASKGVNVRSSGLESADAVNLFIPFSVAAESDSGGVKQYISSQEFLAAQDRDNLWTLSVDTGVETFFIKGEVVLPAAAARAHEDSYKVTKVDMKDFGRPVMQHWEVGGA